MNNTIYGSLGSQYNPYYIKHLASLVTNQARYCLQIVKAGIDDIFGLIDNESRVIMGDTDSVFWRCGDLLNENIPTETR